MVGPNPFCVNNFLDSCAFDPKYEPEATAANEIFRLHEEEKLLVQIAYSTRKEIQHPNTPGWVKREARGLVFTLPVSRTIHENQLLDQIIAILAGEGKPQNIIQDAMHIFEAQKYGGYFVTTDERLLKRADAIFRICSVQILKPTEFLQVVDYFSQICEDD